jgi:hypothetical protein
MRSLQAARFSMFGMMAVLAPLAFAGCVAPGDEEVAGDELATEKIAGDQTASSEQAIANAQCMLGIEIRNVTCISGWPGSRCCHWNFVAGCPVVPNTITVQITGHNGEIGHTAAVLPDSSVDFTTTVHEGEAFNPGSNTTSYTLAWLHN